MLDRRAVILLCSALALFALSLALPALAVLDKPLLGGAPTPKVFTGFVCLAMGWLYLPGWIGNPLFVAATILHGLRRHRIAIALLSLAVVSALLAPLVIASTHNSMFELRRPLAGYYVWVASMVVMLASATRSAFRDLGRRAALGHAGPLPPT